MNDVDVRVSQGEIIGLLGPNGAGKTTTFYMIMGLIQPNAGEVFLDQEELTDVPMYRVTDSKKPNGVPDISYVLARRIVVAFKDGQVGSVDLDGAVRGIHLQPQEPAKSKDTKATPPKKVAAARPAAGSSK